MDKVGVPPHSVETEEAVLGCLIADSKVFDNVSAYVKIPDVFYVTKHQMLFKKIVGMVKKNELVDATTISASLTKKEKENNISAYWITSLTSNAPSSTNSEYYSRILYEKYLLRSLIDKTRGITESAFESNADIYQFLESTYSQIGEAIRVRPGEDFDIDNLLEDTIINLSDNDNTICTGFRDIDELTGGMTRGEITIIGGRPSHGKTTLAMNIVSNIINGRKHKVCFINREMTNIEMMNKLMVLESGNVSYKMLRKRALTKKDFEEIERTKETIKEKYNSDKFVMFDNIRDFATSSSQIKKFCPDVIVDDYVQLIQPVTETKDRRLQIEEIVNSYKWIAKELNCVVILVSQLNRSIETRVNPKPRMSDLAESGSLEQAAENILFVYYDYKVHYEESEKGKDVIEVIASKVRYGESGSVDMKYNGDKCSFESEELIPY